MLKWKVIIKPHWNLKSPLCPWTWRKLENWSTSKYFVLKIEWFRPAAYMACVKRLSSWLQRKFRRILFRPNLRGDKATVTDCDNNLSVEDIWVIYCSFPKQKKTKSLSHNFPLLWALVQVIAVHSPGETGSRPRCALSPPWRGAWARRPCSRCSVLAATDAGPQSPLSFPGHGCSRNGSGCPPCSPCSRALRAAPGPGWAASSPQQGEFALATSETRLPRFYARPVHADRHVINRPWQGNPKRHTLTSWVIHQLFIYLK